MDKEERNLIDLDAVKEYIRAHLIFPEEDTEVFERNSDEDTFDYAESCICREEEVLQERKQNLSAPKQVFCCSGPLNAGISSLEKALGDLDESFAEMLTRLIRERGMKNSDVYKRALVSKAVFSNIMTKPDYRPQKTTLFALAISLKLNLEETKKLLERAGYALSHSFKLDVAMEYFIKNEIYNIFEINEILFDLDLPILGERTA